MGTKVFEKLYRPPCSQPAKNRSWPFRI